jgi:hypothetical protein
MRIKILTEDQQVFLTSILSEEAQQALNELRKNYKADLTSNSHITWTVAKKNAVFRLAGKLLFEGLNQLFNREGHKINRTEFLEQWTKVVRQVLEDPSWKQISSIEQEEILEDYEIAQRHELKIRKELLPFILFLLGMGVLIKVVLLYLGANGYLSLGVK